MGSHGDKNRAANHNNPLLKHSGKEGFGSTHSLTWSGSQPYIAKPKPKIAVHGDDTAEPPKGRVTCPLVIVALVSIFGASFPHGFNTGVLNVPTHLIQSFINGSFTERSGSQPDESVINILWATTNAVYLVGGCGGAYIAGYAADYFGRKKALLLVNIFGYIATALFAFCKLANSFEMLILARLITGFGCGAGSGLVPMYLTEIAPINLRGAMGVLHQLALTAGIFSSNVLGFRQLLGTETLWPVLLSCIGIPCVVSCVVLPFFPDSPRYLLCNKDDREAAKKALIRFRGTTDVGLELDEMELEKEEQQAETAWTMRQLLRTKSLRLPLLLVCSLAMSQQLSGINVVFYYSTPVYIAAGIPMHAIQYAVMGNGLINFVLTLISVPLMEKFGRRPLLLSGMIIMIVASAVITVALKLQEQVQWLSYISILCTLVFVVGFSIGLGSIPQFIGAELFKTGPRPPAMSLSGFLNWLCNFAVAIGFPSIQQALGPYSFLIFIVTTTGFLIFIWLKLPETKQKTYDEIYQIFQKNTKEEPTPNGTEMPIAANSLLKNGKGQKAVNGDDVNFY